MKLALLLACAATASAFAEGAPLRLSGGAKAENRLRLFIERDARLKARLEDAARREEAFLSQARESDLRDAVSDVSGARLRLGLEALPGMKAPPAPACRALKDCPVPDLALDVTEARLLPDSLRRMVRPWLALQRSRGSDIELAALDGPGDAVLAVRVKGLDAEPLVLNAAPRLLGGFHVWFDRPFVLAALYGRERDAVLRAAR